MCVCVCACVCVPVWKVAMVVCVPDVFVCVRVSECVCDM